VDGIASLFSRLFDIVVSLGGGSPAWAMVIVSVVTAVWVLLLFKAVTPQERLQRTRDRLFGHIYEMGMYQDRLGVVGRIQRDLAKANFGYLALTLPALLALTVPMVITLAQLDSRYAHRPLAPGETTVLSVAAADAAGLDALALEAPAGVEVEAGPVRDRAARSVAWRLKATEPGSHELVITRDGAAIATRTLEAGDRLIRVGEKAEPGPLSPWLAPGAGTVPRDVGLAAVTLRYPSRSVRYLGVELDWLVAFMLLSLAAGLAVKDLLRVSI
jgi:hypothetical protein